MRITHIVPIRVPIVVALLSTSMIACAESADTSSAGDTRASQDAVGDDGTNDVAPGTDAISSNDEDTIDDVLAPDDTTVQPDAVPSGACTGQPDGASCDLDGDPCTIDVCASEACIATNGVESCAAEAALEPCWTLKCES